MHPQVSVSAVSSWSWTFAEDLAFWTAAGVGRVGLSLRKCEAAGARRVVREVCAAGLEVTNLVECGWPVLGARETWVPFQDRVRRGVEMLGECGGGVLVLTSGPGLPLDFDGSVGALGEVLAPVRDVAAGCGVRVAIENTGPLRVDLSFLTTVRDTCDAAARLGVDVCMETSSCWAERALAATLSTHADRVAHVQVSDWRVGSHCTPDRLVPGDGDVPLRRLVGLLRDVAYERAYEIEMVGPRIEAEGYASAIRRAVAGFDAILSARG